MDIAAEQCMFSMLVKPISSVNKRVPLSPMGKKNCYTKIRWLFDFWFRWVAREQANQSPHVRLFLSKNSLDGGYICDIGLDKTEVPSSLKTIQVRLLEGNIIVVIEIVDAQNFVPAINKPMRDMRTDEASGSCDKNFHLWNQSEPDDKQLNMLGKNHKNIQKADFVVRLRCRCRVVVLHFLKRIMAAKRHKKTQKRKGIVAEDEKLKG